MMGEQYDFLKGYTSSEISVYMVVKKVMIYRRFTYYLRRNIKI